MHSGGAGNQRHIGAIVDNDACTIGGDLQDLFNLLKHYARIGVFAADLDQASPACKQRLGQMHWVSKGSVCDGVQTRHTVHVVSTARARASCICSRKLVWMSPRL